MGPNGSNVPSKYYTVMHCFSLFRIWDYTRQQTPLETIEHHTEFVYGLDFNIHNPEQVRIYSRSTGHTEKGNLENERGHVKVMEFEDKSKGHGILLKRLTNYYIFCQFINGVSAKFV